MELEFIVTLASPEVRLRFLAMERSLRATGCQLPLRVIPYNDGRFALPPNAEWWLDAGLAAWLGSWEAHLTMRKYQCLTEANYQFVDSDVVFLRNPAEVLRNMDGFVSSCGHWKNPAAAITDESLRQFCASSTNWQTAVFNSGQFACDRALFTYASLRERCESAEYKGTCLTFPHNEQPGINLLVHSCGVPIKNLTLPPWSMESTWAGDYPGDYTSYWKNADRKPYLIHWAGCRMDERRPIDELMELLLTQEELHMWKEEVKTKQRTRVEGQRRLPGILRRLKRTALAVKQELREC